MQTRKDLRKVIITKGEGTEEMTLIKAYFHEWGDFKGLTENGVVWGKFAIIEHEDGTVHKYFPEQLKFVDTF